MNFTLQPDIPFLHRPLIIYIFSGLIEMISNMVYTMHGFQRLSLPNTGMKYWYKPSSSTLNDQQLNDKESANNYPLLFMHGISLGYLGYYKLITALGKGREGCGSDRKLHCMYRSSYGPSIWFSR